ncbi:MAG: glycosyltransferase [Desulfobacterales bacterium]|nr:glycosyltransferase [Desulfobacterales bacterium]MBF0395406.1 glycosyltransferase [Desulfobacterales bacterium]
MLKIAHITLTMDAGGIEQLILNMAKSIDRKQFEFSIVCLDGGGLLLHQIKELGCKTFVLKRSPGLDIKLICKLIQLFRSQKFHIIHAHNQAALFYAGLSAKFAMNSSIITTEHSRHYIDKLIRRRFEKKILSYITDKWVVVSDKLAEMSMNRDHINPKRIKVIHNGIDITKFKKPANINLNEFKKNLDIPIDRKIIIMVARFNPVKNHDLLLYAFSRLKNYLDPMPHLLLIGEGTLRNDIIQLSYKLSINTFVHFLGFREDINKLLWISDLFVLCSKTEGLPLSMLEAWAANVPVLITHSANRAGLVKNDENGRVINSDATSITQGIYEMLSAPENNNKLIQNAYHVVNNNFSLNRMINEYEEIYKSLWGKNMIQY